MAARKTINSIIKQPWYLIAAAIVVVIGIIIIISARAAVAPVSLEAEAGTLTSGATGLADTQASGGKYVQFGAVVSTGDPVIAAAGDIACSPTDPLFNGGLGTSTGCGQMGTGKAVIALKPAAVLTLGDTQYQTGSLTNYMASYDKAWGSFKNITFPSIGNHEYGTSGGSGYFSYFGDRGTPQDPGCRSNCRGYYSFNIGSWHLIALNSECNNVSGGCAVGSPQEKWLRADLAANPTACTLAYWHEPYWAPGALRSDAVLPLLKALYDNNAELVLNGHDHNYMRYAPQNPSGQADAARGIRQIIVGSGGAEFTGIGTNVPNVQKSFINTFGVLSVALHSNSYSWNFIGTGGSAQNTDTGTTTCH